MIEKSEKTGGWRDMWVMEKSLCNFIPASWPPPVFFSIIKKLMSPSGEGNGNPLQCSCLENPRDGGAWWAAVYGVAQSRTRLKRLSNNSNLSIHTSCSTMGKANNGRKPEKSGCWRKKPWHATHTSRKDPRVPRATVRPESRTQYFLCRQCSESRLKEKHSAQSLG